MPEEVKNTELTKDYQLTLKSSHTHKRILYEKGTKIGEFKPTKETIAFLKKHLKV